MSRLFQKNPKLCGSQCRVGLDRRRWPADEVRDSCQADARRFLRLTLVLGWARNIRSRPKSDFGTYANHTEVVLAQVANRGAQAPVQPTGTESAPPHERKIDRIMEYPFLSRFTHDLESQY